MKALRWLVLASLLTGCGGPLRYQVASSPQAPGADAVIVADVQEAQDQTQLEVTVEHLPPADRVAPGSTAFVAWYRKDSKGVWSRVGSLTFDDDARSGSLKGSVPETAFDFEITAEVETGPASPSAHIVFSQRVAK